MVAMANKTLLVSIPRSGNGWVSRTVQRNTGPNYFCEGFNCLRFDDALSPIKMGAEECTGADSNGHCQLQRPLTKAHDFSLTLPILDSIVLIRHPLPSLVSWYKWRSRRHQLATSKRGFQKFCELQLSYMAGFMNKWWTNPNVTHVTYEGLLKSSGFSTVFGHLNLQKEKYDVIPPKNQTRDPHLASFFSLAPWQCFEKQLDGKLLVKARRVKQELALI